MSNQVQFHSFDFQSSAVRIITDPNQDLWFCGTDVCGILGYQNAPEAMKKHCKQSGIAKRYISYPSGRKEAIFINEPNLYRLIIKSRKPQAEKFEAWVFEEVLPQIRKTGQYLQNSAENRPLVAPKPIALPAPSEEPELTLAQALLFAQAWETAEKMRWYLYQLYEPLKLLNANLTDEVHYAVKGQSCEHLKKFRFYLQHHLPKDIDYSELEEHQARLLHSVQQGHIRIKDNFGQYIRPSF